MNRLEREGSKGNNAKLKFKLDREKPVITKPSPAFQAVKRPDVLKTNEKPYNTEISYRPKYNMIHKHAV